MAEVNQAKFTDNLLVIDQGVYGEDVRLAIKENIEINNQLISDLNANITALNNRVDSLDGSGGGGDEPGPSPGPSTTGGIVAGGAEVSIEAAISIYIVSGEAIAV